MNDKEIKAYKESAKALSEVDRKLFKVGYRVGYEEAMNKAEKRYAEDRDNIQRQFLNQNSVITDEQESYYHRNGIEVMDIIREVFTFFGKSMTSFESAQIFNIMKYLMRYKFKGDPAGDLLKAKDYIDYLIMEIKE